MATLRELMTDALLALGKLAIGEEPDANDAAICLRAINRRIDQWSAERLTIYTVTRSTWTITSGTQDYLVGSGQTVNIARPVYIERVNYTDSTISPTQEKKLQKFEDAGWQAVTTKALESPLPTNWYYNPTYPYGTLTLWPKPTATTLTGVIYAPTAVSEFTSIQQEVSLPPGYRRMIIYQLALEMAGTYQRQVPPHVMSAAQESMAVVKRMNYRPLEMGFEPAALIYNGENFDILTGE